MSLLTVQRLTMLVFFLQPVAFGSWLPRIPDVQDALGLGPAGLALALLGLPCGTLLTLPFAGPIVGRIGPRRTLMIGFVLYTLAVCLPALATSPMVLFACLMLAGSSISFVELGLNVQADAVEKSTGSLIMSTSHGFWSLGIMTGSLIGSGLAAIDLTASLSIPLVAVVVLPIALLAALRLPDAAPQPHHDQTTKGSAWSLPSPALLGICLFVFGITMTEGAMADWSAVFLRQVFGADGGTAGLGYSLFAMMVAVGRFGGDRLKARFGAVSLARSAGLLALGGVAILLVASNTAFALAGFAVIGLGVSVGFPLAVSAVASLTDRASSTNVAVLSFIALLGFLVGPPVIGFIAEHVAMRIGLATLLPMLAISLILTGQLSRGRGQSAVADAEAKIPGEY